MSVDRQEELCCLELTAQSGRYLQQTGRNSTTNQLLCFVFFLLCFHNVLFLAGYGWIPREVLESTVMDLSE